MNDKKQYLVGAHVSISGGFFKAIEEGIKIGCTAIQIFTKSNRQWKSKPITDSDADLFITAQKESDIKIVVAHASYLINLGSATHEVQKKSYTALVDEIKRCHQLKIPFLVLHPGTAESGSKEIVLKQTGDYINQALEETSNCITAVLIETMAGQGKSIGSSFEELAMMLHQITHKKRIGICFDTCHAFAAGYEFSTPQSYAAMFKQFDATIGLQYLKMFHMNDSKKELGSHVDRHENIGKGAIKLEAFSLIMNDHRFTSIPKIVETPKDDDLENDKRNVRTLIDLIK
ncbi:MAG: deoxyribonuclease IV [Candidatus Dependentiae bacterium]|nr:deoxyribonuclease IV [Candidatus Dependentiae bacterium]